MENQQNTSTKITRITTLADHRRLLTHVFETARERVIVVSPFISSSAIKADGVDSLIRSTTRRGVSVSVYTDSQLNMTEQGEIKESAGKGIRMIANSGGKVYIVNGIHHKTLIRDDDLITEGSFNWLSAVRSKGAAHQREERTMVIEGEEAREMISEEFEKLRRPNLHSPLHAQMTLKEYVVYFFNQYAKKIAVILGPMFIMMCAIIYNNGGSKEWQLWVLAGIALPLLPSISTLLEESNRRKRCNNPMLTSPLYDNIQGNIYHDGQ